MTEPGVEVELRPAGKQVTRLSLLSGGEKALGAIAFLFALLLARPCPFYVLDEVDAALDDTNIGRFLELLRRYADRAQFIVITHQKRTMEMADVLYGVTMAGDGVSKVVSRRLPREPGRRLPAASRDRLLRWRGLGRALGDRRAPRATPEERRRGFFARLRDSLVQQPARADRADRRGRLRPGRRRVWERLEEALIAADVGVPATAEIVRRLEARGGRSAESRPRRSRRRSPACSASRRTLDARRAADRDPRRRRQRHRQDDHDRQARAEARASTVAGARRRRPTPSAPPPRSSSRSGPSGQAPTSSGSERGGDPAAVAFDAVEAAESRGRDVVIVDTAGRLHTQTNLMEELAKVRRVIAQRLEGAPHETLLVVDATTGQNGLQQARLFGRRSSVTGIALTKLDGTAKGGIAIAIAHELGLPVKLIGIGEGLDDLRPFDPDDFARALVGG